MEIKIFLIALVIILLLDFVWIGLIMKKFYTAELSKIARLENGKLAPMVPVGLLVYIILAIGIAIFVFPLAKTNVEAIIFGALIGLVIYGVYDFTNFATLKDFSLRMTLTDLTWGTFLCSITSFLTKVIGK